MFAVTNIDDVVVLSLFFGQAEGRRRGSVRVVVGQHAGFGLIHASVVGALGADLLPDG
ncbi:MAG TPA: hypothetical protein VIO57_13245 [Chloroflexota bacterium]|jgi:cadmium resistance protein CadD (predicted permease)